MKTIEIFETGTFKGFEIAEATKQEAIECQNVVPAWMQNLAAGTHRFLIRNTPFGRFWIQTVNKEGGAQ